MDTISKPLRELFDFPSINGLTEEYINNNPGNIPVYGGKKTGTPIGYIADNLEDVKYFYNCLGWNREGSIGYVFWHKHKFTTNDHHRPLILKNEYSEIIDLGYVRIALETMLLSIGFSWGKTASKTKVMDMSIDLPVDDKGNISLVEQHKYVQKYSKIFEVQNELNRYQDILKKSLVEIEKKFSSKNISLGDDEIFNLEIGKRVTKKELIKEGIPVYSANVKIPFGNISKSNISNFDRDSLLWGIDGNFDWNIIRAGEVFATTDHCGRLTIINNDIKPEYVFFLLRESSSSYGFNRTYRASLKNITEVTLPIPVNKDGSYNIEMQEVIINKYKYIDSIKGKLLNKLKLLTETSVDIV